MPSKNSTAYCKETSKDMRGVNYSRGVRFSLYVTRLPSSRADRGHFEWELPSNLGVPTSPQLPEYRSSHSVLEWPKWVRFPISERVYRLLLFSTERKGMKLSQIITRITNLNRCLE